MSDVFFFTNWIHASAYKYIVLVLCFLFLFKDKIPIVNKIEVKIHLPEEFMRHFRWITPLLLIVNLIFSIVIYLMLNAVIAKLGVSVG